MIGRKDYSKRVALIGCVALLLPIVVSASPLDDRIKDFREAPTQTDQAVVSILDAGLAEGRSAAALAGVKQWIAANPSNSKNLLHKASMVAERSGDFSLAASLYRKLLMLPDLDGRTASDSVPAFCRLLVNQLDEVDSAYLFLKQEGPRLQRLADLNRYNRWFLDRAVERKDLTGLATWLTMLLNGSEPLDLYQDDLDALLREVETFRHSSKELLTRLEGLAKSKRATPDLKARIGWVVEISPLLVRMAEAFNAKTEVNKASMLGALRAAENLVKIMPYEGAKLVAKGWLTCDQGDSRAYKKWVSQGGPEKAESILKVLRQLPAQQAKAILEHYYKDGRPVSNYLLTTQQLRELLIQKPELFNCLDAPAASLWDKELTLEETKAMAPHLARNPSIDAAVIRAIAATPSGMSEEVVEAMMTSEMWRTDQPSAAIDRVRWMTTLKHEGVDWGALTKKYAKLGAEYEKVSKQVAKAAKPNERKGAFQKLKKDLSSGSPSISGAAPLWVSLFTNAPSEELVGMLKSLSDEGLLRFTADRITIGKAGRLPWRAKVYGNHFRYHQADTRKLAGEFITELETRLKGQMAKGAFSETTYGLWLHSVNPGQEEAKAFAKEIIASPAFSKLPRDYQLVTEDREHFGRLPREGGGLPAPRDISKELLALPAEAAPDQVVAAFKTVMERAAKSPVPVQVLGLQKVAALPEWDQEIRKLSHSLFREHAPLGKHTKSYGYEQMVIRVATEIEKSADWKSLELLAGGLWHAVEATDDPRQYRDGKKLAELAAVALETGQASVAMTVVRAGLNSQAGKTIAASKEEAAGLINGQLRMVAGKAAGIIGAVEIPVDETDPSYPIYKSSAEYALGNEDSAWQLYLENAGQLSVALRSQPINYLMWLLDRNISADRDEQAETLVKELTIWSREAPGTLDIRQDAQLKIAYADLAFRKGALPTSRAWYRRVAEAAETEGTEMQLTAALGSVKVDRVSKNYGAAMTELDKLMKLPDPEFRKRVRFAKAEVLMDQESYAEALEEVEQVLRQEPKHPDALILRGQIHYQMRKLVEASEIELGPSQDKTVIVPGEALKINLRDPTLRISGVGADIEVEIKAKSGDSERVLLYQLGDSKEKFRAEIPTRLGPPTPNDKVLQILGEDEITYGYSARFRAKMKDLPEDPDVVIRVAADARLSVSAGAFPPREGERRLNIEELGISTAQAALGTRSVRPGNPVYIRVNDSDRSVTPQIDEVPVSLVTSSGDEIRRLMLKETAPFSGEFQGVVATTGAQALAYASESAPGRDPNMAISSKDYPGWQGIVGSPEDVRTFGVNLNDLAMVDKMTIQGGEEGENLTRFVLQTSLNGTDWITRARFPYENDQWDGRPHVSSFPTYRNGHLEISAAKDGVLPDDWKEKMELLTSRKSVSFLAKNITSLTAEPLPMVSTGHPGYSGLIRFRALFYQESAAIRRFQLAGLPALDADGKMGTIFLLDGEPANEEAENPLVIERELLPGLHDIEFWCHWGRDKIEKAKPVILCDVPGEEKLQPCPDAMFNPATFPEPVRALLPQPAEVKATAEGGFEVAFGDRTEARLIRLVITGFNGAAPSIGKITLSDREGGKLLPVERDFMSLRSNDQLEVLPGDQITVRYEDPKPVTPKRNRHEGRVGVAFNDAEISASFLTYITTDEGRELVLEPIRRFRFEDPVAIVVDDADMDVGPEKDLIEVMVTSAGGQTITIKAVETEEHSGRFLGRVFPVLGEPSRASEITVPEGGMITASYQDTENLNPGISTTRSVDIQHARYSEPVLETYAMSSEAIPDPEKTKEPVEEEKSFAPKVEVVEPQRILHYDHVAGSDGVHNVLAGASLHFDLVVPHLAFAGSSTINAYVQTESARKAMKEKPSAPFDLQVPGSLKLTGKLSRVGSEVPAGYQIGRAPVPPTNAPPLEEGRFSFSVPLILGDTPDRSYATKAAESLSSSALPDGLAIKAGDVVHVAYAYEDPDDVVRWKMTSFQVGSDSMLDVMKDGYSGSLSQAFVGEKVSLRVIDRGGDQSPNRDKILVSLKAESGAGSEYELQETEPHSGIFKGVFTLSYAPEKLPAKLPPISLNGFPVRYGDTVTISYGGQSRTVGVNMGADGLIQPFSKRFSGDDMAITTSFTLAECFFELAKKHREMEQESLARREMAQARKLLAEAVAAHRSDEMKAHAEYLLGNLAQEYADLAKNDEAKLPMYQDALARFTQVAGDFPDSEFAPKSQFKTALVYEKMGETDNAVEEYVKMAYKFPEHELIPSVMSRLGGYYQKRGMAYKKKADAIREEEDDASKAEVLRLDGLSYPEFLNAAMVFSKLHERFPRDPLSGLAVLRSAQNYMRAHQYEKAIVTFKRAYDNEEYDDREIRSQAMYWSGLSNERLANTYSEENWKGRGTAMREAFQLYRRVTFDFPDSIWAKYARGRLADPVFARMVEEEKKERERMIESLKELRKKR